jgi:hypothetical protein
MKKYTYKGSSILSFTYENKDFVIYGNGPHQLPEESAIVKTLVAKGDLIDQSSEVAELNSPESKNVKR